MATPKTVTDGSSDLDEAVLNLFLRAGKAEVKINYALIRFTAATNVVTVVSGTDSDGEIVSADCTWDAVDVRVEITVTGFTAPPLILATLHANASTNVEKILAQSISTSLVGISFRSNATPGAAVDPDGDVDVAILVIGV